MSEYLDNAINEVVNSLDESTTEHDREKAYFVVDILNFLKNQPNYVVTWDAQVDFVESANNQSVYFKAFCKAKEKFSDRFENKGQSNT